MKFVRILEPTTTRLLMGIGTCFSMLLYALLFKFTNIDPIMPIQIGYALGLCLIISIGVFLSFLVITSFGIWESIFTTSLWIIASVILTVFLCKIDQFSIINGLHEPNDYMHIVVVLSLFHLGIGFVFAYLLFPYAIKFKKNHSNYYET